MSEPFTGRLAMKGVREKERGEGKVEAEMCARVCMS